MVPSYCLLSLVKLPLIVSGRLFTCTVAVSLIVLPAMDAVMVASPALTGVTAPSLTVATLVLLLDQVMTGIRADGPTKEGVSVAVTPP